MVTINISKGTSPRRSRCRIILASILIVCSCCIFSLLQIGSEYRDQMQLLNQMLTDNSLGNSIDYSRNRLKTIRNRLPKSAPSVAYVICLHSAPTSPNGTFAVKNPHDGRSLVMAPSLAVLVESVRRIAPESRYRTHLVALVRRSIVSEFQEALVQDYGFDEIIPVDRLVNFEDMAEPGRKQAQTNKIYFAETLVSEENDKLYIYNMTNYDRVVLLDTDVIMVKPIDELLDDPAETLGTLDYYALRPGEEHAEGGMMLSVVPPINAGFVVARPSATVFQGVQDMLRRGKFTTGLTKDGYVSGWDGLGIGYFFGGISIQGVLPAYYFTKAIEDGMNQHNMTRYQAVQAYLHPKISSSSSSPAISSSSYFREVDQCIYNVLGHKNCQGREAGVQGTPNCLNADCSPEVNPTMEGIKAGLKVLHFTGSCLGSRPWKLCQQSQIIQKSSIPELCQEFIHHWVDTASDFLNDQPKNNNARQVAPTLPSCVKRLQQGSFQ